MAETPHSRTARNAAGATARCLRQLATMVEAAAEGDGAAAADLSLFLTGRRLGVTLDDYMVKALGLTPYLQMIEGE